jgi:UDP-N-acetylmuramate--alanine ligase
MIVAAADEPLPAEALGRVHFVGIGGAGLSGIARIMLARGLPVSGSDAADSDVLAALRELGARCWVGHAAEHVAAADTVVVSTAIRADNPEVREAKRRGLRLLPRSAALSSVMVDRRVVAVAGTHGKTTTTAMLTVALRASGADPSYAIGGDLCDTGSNAHEGSGELFVAEADESDGAFLTYSPFGAVVTNVEADHLDVYGTPAAYAAAFDAFVPRIAADGFLVPCADDPGAARLGQQAADRGLRVLSAGLADSAQLRGESLRLAGDTSSLQVVHDGRRLGGLRLRTTGRHYVLDALCALGAGLALGYPFASLAGGLEQFRGTRRRMEAKGSAGGVRVYDSYAHHPSEIAGDLAAARALAGDGRVVVCFQPHLVSRTRTFATAMGAALGAADEVVVMDVYVAREEADPAVSGALVAAAVPKPADRVHFEPSWELTASAVADRSRPGDVVVTLGAGDVTRLGPLILELLGQRRPADGGEAASG